MFDFNSPRNLEIIYSRSTKNVFLESDEKNYLSYLWKQE